MDRYERQRLLEAVGDRGQERIANASYALGPDSDPASLVERAYLERAGAQRFSDTPSEEAFVHAAAFRHEAARAYARGAWRALRQLRSALELAP